MDENHENRDNARIDHTSSIQVQDIKSGRIYKARMSNYSKNGIYFESDSVLETNTQIYIGIQDSPYAPLSGILEYYKGKVMWRRELEESFFQYGYGVQFASVGDKKDSKTSYFKTRMDLRRHPRKPYTQPVVFVTPNGISEGLTKNVSPSGAFIATDKTFEAGQTITIALPIKDNIEAKVKGQIVWANGEGFGLRFLKKV